MSLGKFPLSSRMVIDLLGPLVGARGKIQFHHIGYLENMMSHLWLLNVNTRDWVRRVRAALFLVERGFNEHPHEIAPIVYQTASRSGPIQMEVSGLSTDAWNSGQAEEPDRRFQPLLALYPCLYERYYPLLAAPLIASDCLLRTKADLSVRCYQRGDNPRARVCYPQAATTTPRYR